jgi:hypothetical protein
MLLLSAFDDPETAAELALHDIEVAADRLRSMPPEVLNHYRDVCADLGAELNDIAAPRRPQ